MDRTLLLADLFDIPSERIALAETEGEAMTRIHIVDPLDTLDRSDGPLPEPCCDCYWFPCACDALRRLDERAITFDGLTRRPRGARQAERSTQP